MLLSRKHVQHMIAFNLTQILYLSLAPQGKAQNVAKGSFSTLRQEFNSIHTFSCSNVEHESHCKVLLVLYFSGHFSYTLCQKANLKIWIYLLSDTSLRIGLSDPESSSTTETASLLSTSTIKETGGWVVFWTTVSSAERQWSSS